MTSASGTRASSVGGIVLAAGAGSRFGGRKQLAPFRGRPLIEHALEAMAAAPVDPVILVLGADAELVRERAELRGALLVVCADWADGQSASLRAGLAALDHADAAVVVLGDQPLISPDAVARVVAARSPEADAVRASYDGVCGHPVLLERRVWAGLAALSGDAGARELLGGLSVRAVPCDGLGSPEDIDTPNELEVLQA